ncbi:keto reductase family 1 member C1 homolog [Seminavis robusta]|uniref:Keto reductase family 1 member C1 homolog n=1 Tax=Seminavis robusta TaxID=568900 RepID=A0A9N8E5Z0_9STRA|nr:keto reductase family 1 member C1 homolog [Seminavis robusta]|eukprot:Sro584_g170830.1 keto reductase family 1 member C1 homolog (318) ;mRNA; f:40278-41231
MGKFSRVLLALTAAVLAMAHANPALMPLNDGNHMAQVGMGVHMAAPGQECYQSVRWGLEVGYRLIDTADVYQNEADVGRAIVDSGIPRDQIFITTKLAAGSHGYQNAMAATDLSLQKLQTSYVDLLLIHSPYGAKLVETWDAMVELQKQGKVKSIGVSNFGIQHLEALREHGRPTPAVNQIELHPLNYQERKELVEYCKQHNIAITAYGSLFFGFHERYQDPVLQSVAEKYQKTVPQILLRWGLEIGVAVIPKSASSKQRLEQNWAILDFALTPEEVESISAIKGAPLGAYWDPVRDAGVDIGDLSHGGSSVTGEEL